MRPRKVDRYKGRGKVQVDLLGESFSLSRDDASAKQTYEGIFALGF